MAAEKRTTGPRPVSEATNASAHSGGRCSATSRDTTRSNWPFTTTCSVRSTAMNRSSGICSILRLTRSEEHTSELQSLTNLVCRLLLEKKKKKKNYIRIYTPKNNNTK